MSNTSLVYINAPPPLNYVPCSLLSSTDTHHTVKVTSPITETTVYDAEKDEDIIKLYAAGTTHTVPCSDYRGGVLPLQNTTPTGLPLILPDLISLPALHEPSILTNLTARHLASQPYTSCGTIILAMNPYHRLPELYTSEIRTAINHHYLTTPPPTTSTIMPPHCYQTSAQAYAELLRTGVNQSILVSGESGAGKTETVKILMTHLSSIPPTPLSSPVVSRILDGAPLLESFGNAKTLRNDNSSRFGKYTQLQFRHTHNGQCEGLKGSLCDVYLLEKSRVCGANEGERVYHIFYQLLAAPAAVKASIWPELENKTGADFAYVGPNQLDAIIEGESDATKWTRTRAALDTLSIPPATITHLLQGIVVCLQFGNITFEATDKTTDDGSTVTSGNELELLADLLQVDATQLKEKFTFRTMKARSDEYKVPLSPAAAKEGADAFAKELYQRLFLFLVSCINTATAAPPLPSSHPSQTYSVIGLLDIFGFESFETNRFEQLCINWCNEKLQQKFTVDVFQAVVREYEQEGIELQTIEFDDNVDVLNLIEGRMGAVSILNEECVRPKGSDTSFVSKLYSMNEQSSLIQNKRFRPHEFSIEHYAGPVVYDATDFVRKNADAMPLDLVDLALASTNPLISTLFPLPTPSPKESTSRRGSALVMATVWTKFKTQLSTLMGDLAKTNTRYIRCIKPNKLKKPFLVDNESTIDQLRCAGVVAAVTISRAAFPNRLDKDAVVERFGCLVDLFSGTADELVPKLLPTESYEVGLTKIYFRANQLEILEQRRLSAMSKFATRLCTHLRMWMARRQFVSMRAAAILIQSVARAIVQCDRYEKTKTAILVAQCFVRCTRARRTLRDKKRTSAATHLQAFHRRGTARSAFAVKRAASTRICAAVRGRVQMRRYKIELKEAVEERKLENQLKTLQRKLEEAELKQKEAEEKLASKRPLSPQKQPANGGDGGDEVAETDSSDEGFVAVEDSHQLMDESGRMLEYLRKEVFKLRSANVAQRTENERLKENNRRLSDANAAAGASFAALNQHTKQLSKANMKYVGDIANYKAHISRMQLQMSELKEELKMKQATYIAEVHTRIQFAKMLQVVARTVEDKGEDVELAAEVNAMVEDCFAYDSERPGMDIDVSRMKTPGRTVKKKKRKSLLMSFVSPPSKGQDDSFDLGEEEGGMEGVVSGVAETLGKGFRGIFGFGEKNDDEAESSHNP